MPTKEKLYREFKDRQLVVLATSFQEPEELVKDFQKEFSLSFPVLYDTHGKVSEKYEFRGHPATFVIDRKGFVVGKVLGERDWSSAVARELVTDLLKDR